MVDCRTKSSFDADTQPWRELACSIMLQASNDYLECLAQRKTQPNSKYWNGQVQELEAFFRSDFYTLLTTVDPELLMNTLQSRILGRKE